MHILARLAVGALLHAPLAAGAHEFRAGSITVDNPWARATIGETGSTAAYMKLENAGATPDRLVAAKSNVSDHISLHETRDDNGIARMEPVDGIDVPAGGSAELKPLGLHVMLTQLEHPLRAGETFPLTLVFEKQGEVPVEVKVEAPRKESDAGDHQHQHP